MRVSKFISLMSTFLSFIKIKKCFFKDNALKNPVVFVLLSQKMKIILSYGESIHFIIKIIKIIAKT